MSKRARLTAPPPGSKICLRERGAMVKIFQGDCQTVESDMNSWIEVYHPRIVDMKQAIFQVEREHSFLLVLTVLYEARSETEKVEYKIYGAHQEKQKQG
jgi:hypothetical protein